MEFEERKSDPVIVLAADKASSSAFNYPLYRIFADPSNTAGLVIDPQMAGGFKFEVLDVKKNMKVVIKAPEELNELVALIGSTQRYTVSRIWRARDDLVAADTSTTKLSLIARS